MTSCNWICAHTSTYPNLRRSYIHAQPLRTECTILNGRHAQSKRTACSFRVVVFNERLGILTIPAIIASAMLNGGLGKPNFTDFIGQSSYEKAADDYAQKWGSSLYK